VRDRDRKEIARAEIPDGGTATVETPTANPAETTSTLPTLDSIKNPPTPPTTAPTPPPPKPSVAPPSTATAKPPAGLPSGSTPSGVVYLDDLPRKSHHGQSVWVLGGDPEKAARWAKEFSGPSMVHAVRLSLGESKTDTLKNAMPSSASYKHSARLTYDLAGKYASFQSSFRPRVNKNFFVEVWGDGKRLWESGGFVSQGTNSPPADVDVRGVREFSLRALSND